MNGFIEIPSMGRSFHYVLEEQTLTVYSSNSLPLENPTELGLISSDKFLIGTCAEKSTLVVFFVDRTPFGEGIIWSSTSLKVYYYIDGLHKGNLFAPNKLYFAFDELNYFFDVEAGIKRNLLEDKRRVIETVPYEETKKEFKFDCKGVTVDGEFGIVKKLRWGSTIPLELYSQLLMEFPQTSEISFIRNLYAIIKRLFCILCYRRNIHIDEVEMSGIDENGIVCSMGVFHPLYSRCLDCEDEKVLEKTVKHKTIEPFLSELVQTIADEKVHIEHIPETKRDGSRITVARTVLITAAFEWTFEQTYANPPMSPYHQEVKVDVIQALEELLQKEGYNSKKKKTVKMYQKIINGVDRSLSGKIQYALNDCKSILEPFIERLYAINGMEVATFEEIADELQYQRNAYAHGAIDRKLKENIVLDVIILEWLNYCMLFKQVGYDREDIFNAINQIFTRGFRDVKKD